MTTTVKPPFPGLRTMHARAILMAVLLLPAAVLAGCVTPEPGEDVTATAAEPDVPFDPMALHAASGEALEAVPGMDALPQTILSIIPDLRAAEPTMGVTSNGYLFFQAGARTMRSTDRGESWEQVSTTASAPATLDPYIWVDPVTDRIFADQLYLGCSYLSYSDDYGATWITNPAACGIPANDHQKITTGIPLMPGAGVAYPNVVYYGYNGLALGSRVSMSLDGGLTWPLNAESVPPGTTCNGGLHGDLRAGPDGTVWLPKRDCDGPTIAWSSDNGMNWQQKHIGQDAGTTNDTKNPAVAIDSDGNVYVVWAGQDNHLYMSISGDNGGTWTDSVRITPPAMRTATMPQIVAGDAGRIAFAYYGTENGNGGSPIEVPDNTTWGLYLAMSVNALDADPAFATVLATPENDPIQVGGIWMYGGGNASRNLLDFIGLTMDADGRPFVAFADGCVDGCVKDQVPGNSRSALGHVAVLNMGPSLFADVGTLPAYRDAVDGDVEADAEPGFRTLAAMARVDAMRARYGLG